MRFLFADLRYSLRLLSKNPGFAAIAILALALGIGANTALFTAVDAVLLRPMPFAESERLAVVWEDSSHVGFPHNTAALANFVDWRKMSQMFSDMAATSGSTLSLTGDGTPESLGGRLVMGNFFAVTNANPLLGRTINEEDDRTDAKVVVISYSLWQRRFGGETSVIGKSVQLNSQNMTVIGVMPRGFYFPQRLIDAYVPAAFKPADLANRDNHFLTVVARLKPGVTMEQAQSEMTGIGKRLQQMYPDDNRQVGVAVVPLRKEMAGQSAVSLWVLLGAAGCVLLIACANVANLLLAKAAGRSREMAVRTALGANRSRLMSQMITESLLLSLAGGAGGVALAAASMKLLARLVPAAMDVQLAIDAPILFFALGVSVLTGLLFGIAPALTAGRASLAETLKQGGRGGSAARSWMRDALVVSEVALALVLLVGAGLLIKTLGALQSLDVGFQTGNLLTMRTRLPNPKYADPQKRLLYFSQVLDKVRDLPGVEGAAFASALPFTSRGNSTGFRVAGHEPVRTDALFRVATNDYLRVMGVNLLEGRIFDSTDRENTVPVMVINETFARVVFKGARPLGKQMNVSGGQILYTIVGVVRDIRERGFDASDKPGMYLPIAQIPRAWAVPQDLVIRARNPTSLTAAVRQAIWSVDPDQPIAAIRTMDEIIDNEVAGRRQNMALLGAFAMLALLLASLGIYGVLSYAVTERTREIGIRVALGAEASSIVRMIVTDGLKLAGAGLVTGIAAAFAVTRAMRSILFGVEPADPMTFAWTVAVLIAVALAACSLPAIRASRVDPIVTLRDE